MSEMEELERDLTRALQARLNKASPPDDAWEQIVAALSDRPIAMEAVTEHAPDLPPSLDDFMESAVDSAASEGDERRGDDLTVDYLQQRSDESDAPAERKGWSGAVIAVAATILVVVGVVVVADGNGGDVVTDPVSLPSVDDAVAAPGVVDDLGFRWYRVSHGGAVYGGASGHRMNSVTVGGPALVAVGTWVWTSVDGIVWSPVAEAAFGETMADRDALGPGLSRAESREAEMHSVTVGGPGLVAVGSDGDAVVWTSVDGLTWSRVPHDEAVFGGAGLQEMFSVTAAAGVGLVAVGSVDIDAGGFTNNDDDPRTERDAVVWTSVDGLTWSRIPHDEAVFGQSAMISVTAGGPGLVAVGGTPCEHCGLSRAQGPAMVWTSVDGLTWSRVPHDEAIFGGAAMHDVTVWGPGLVAVGSDDRDAVVWTSVDGIAWSRVPHDEAVFGGEGTQRMFSVTAAAGVGLVAVGSVDSDSEPDDWTRGDAAVWTSVDGITWSRVPHDEAIFGGESRKKIGMWSVTAGGPGLVAVGGRLRGPDPAPAAVWVVVAEN